MQKRSHRHDTTPRVNEIAADLRSRIDAGEFPPGTKLPSTRMLAAHYEISGQAIARVVALLKADGVVEGKQGAGVFVRKWEPLVYRPQSEFKRLPPNVDVFTNLLSGEDRDGSQTIAVSTELPDEAVRARLQLAEGELVAVRRRTSFVDGEPYGTDDSFVALRLVEGSDWMREGSVERGTNAVLAELGHELVKALDEIYVRMPKPAETERLALSPGTPVAELISTGHDAEGKPVQVTVCLLRGDRHVIIYERERYPRPERTDT
ncbi:GntR family transcriptional regulator [Streptomyces olivaceoviridis]|uniref:GntR family transcriptional regulator n=1 Tax=Streptomyces olivaceoviridis TaxID=1921 RepID=UPI0033B3BEB1